MVGNTHVSLWHPVHLVSAAARQTNVWPFQMVDTTDDKQKPPTHVTFLLNFLDELQRRK
jgi:hypothetical protein